MCCLSVLNASNNIQCVLYRYKHVSMLSLFSYLAATEDFKMLTSRKNDRKPFFVCNAMSCMNNCSISCITWEHNSTELTVSSSISANNLTFNNIQYSHSGNYCCTANGFTIDCVNLVCFYSSCVMSIISLVL